MTAGLARIALTVAVGAGALAAQQNYRAEIEKWRKEREANLIKDDGWTTVVGLFWLKEGENSAGSNPRSRIKLPEGAPAEVGKFLLRSGKVIFKAAPGVKVTSRGAPVETIEMKPDEPGPATIIEIGDLSMFVLSRGDRFAIRLRDKNSRFRREFKGLKWFPVDEAWRIEAKWVPYPEGKRVAIDNVTGQTTVEKSPGYAVFRIDGKECRLEPVLEGDLLFFIFKDRTAGKETYPGGRFLYAAQPRNGIVMLDFNRAFNPPCAFTPFVTCPLPPPQNHLPVRITAGEMNYHH